MVNEYYSFFRKQLSAAFKKIIKIEQSDKNNITSTEKLASEQTLAFYNDICAKFDYYVLQFIENVFASKNIFPAWKTIPVCLECVDKHKEVNELNTNAKEL